MSRALPRVAAVSAAAICMVAGTALVAPANASPERHRGAPQVTLTPSATYDSGIFLESASEIPAWDPSTKRIFVVNAQAGAVDVLDASAPGELTKLFQLSAVGVKAADGSTIPDGAVANSVSIKNGVAAVAIEHPDKVQHGWVVFARTDGADRASTTLLGAVRVGSLPDSLTFTPQGDRVVVANEAEPNEAYTLDPEGTVSIIDLPRDMKTLSQEHVRTVRFTQYDEGTPLPPGVRIFGPDVPTPEGHADAGRVARNIEPEYVVPSADGTKAYVSLQEANPIAVIDLEKGSIADLWTLPLKDWSRAGNVLDASDRSGAITMRNWPIVGIPQPDGIDTFVHDGTDYVVTANEGDARDWDGWTEETRLGNDRYPLCEDVFGGPTGVAWLKKPENLGRLTVTMADGKRAGENCYEKIHSLGARSFSIFKADGTPVFESGAMLEKAVLAAIEAGELPEHAFNANHSANPSMQARSDDKGVEPEEVTVGYVDGHRLLFVGLERISGVMTFDIDDPANPRFLHFANTRNWDVEYDSDNPPTEFVGDLGTEGMTFIPADESPDGKATLVTANEVSGTTTLFTVDLSRSGKGHDKGKGSDRGNQGKGKGKGRG
ncbi:MAG: choice-of-anchor I family protein [Mobilicoccus sp.]|nr:choice-of-anchor I family protein [Mobilicoccus sp.]